MGKSLDLRLFFAGTRREKIVTLVLFRAREAIGKFVTARQDGRTHWGP